MVATNQREGQGNAQSDKESSSALFPFNQTPPHIHHIPSLALLSNPKDSSSDSNNLSSLMITTLWATGAQGSKETGKFYKINGEAAILEVSL